MSRSLLRALLLAVPALWPVAASAVEILPLAEVRPGMTGVGRTVFDGTRIEEFRVTILGVLENVAPRQSMILARLEGGPLAETGVIAGMSGSPVFVEGRLVGAVAYGFPFSKETIAGLTPIGEMIEATRTDAPRAASARYPSPFRAQTLSRPLDRDSFLSVFRRPLTQVAAATTTGALPGRLAGASLAPLALPLVFRGFDPETFEWARGFFAGLGFAPMLGGGAASVPPEDLPDLAPGAAVSVSLVEGDLDISVTGTVTHIEEGRVYAFGHPFYNLGPTQFPMRKAWVYSVFPSLYQSWKIATAAAAPIGTIDQDRTTAISGRLGPAPRLIPVEVKLTTSRGQERSYSFRLVEDELFSPALAYLSMLSVLQTNERAFGTSTIKVESTLSFSGGRSVSVEDLFSDEAPALRSAALVAAPVAYLMSNEFEKVALDKLAVTVTSYEDNRTASLQRAWVEQAGPLRPGSAVNLRLALRTYRGETALETIPVRIPDNAPPGSYSLVVADGNTLSEIEQREMRQPFVPRDLDQLVRAISSLRHNNRIYARLVRSDDGAIVAGEYLQSLPPSVLKVLGASEPGGQVVPIRTAAVWDATLPTEYVFSGYRVLPLTVGR